MYDYDTHTRHLAELETSVQNARQQSAAMPNAARRLVSIFAALVLTGAVLSAALT